MLYSFFPRFKRMVLDGAFVLQGNRKEELPERIVCCLRMYRLSFEKYKPIPWPAAPQQLGMGPRPFSPEHGDTF